VRFVAGRWTVHGTRQTTLRFDLMSTRSKTSGDTRLLDRLLDDGRISPEQYETVLRQVQQLQSEVFEALLEIHALSEADLLKFLAGLHKTRFVTTEKLAKADINRPTLDKVPKKFAEANVLFPVLFDGQASVLSVVTADPEDTQPINELKVVAGVREVRAFVARPAAIRAAINKAYNGDIHAFAILDKEAHEQFQSMLNVYERNLVSEETMAVALVETRSRDRVISGDTLERRPDKKPSSHATTDSDAYLETLNVLVTLLENSRPDLRGHSAAVARLTRKIGERIGLAPADLSSAVTTAYLHDLGKMSAYHLTAFNAAEYDGHRVAAQKAYATPRRLFEAVGLPDSTLESLDAMYERYDGKGFPSSAAGKDIPLGARIVAITDTYADLTQNPRNPFRKTLRPAEACDVFDRFKGAIFDPHLVEVFRHMVTGDAMAARLLANRHKALVVDPDPEETALLELRMLEQGFEVTIVRTADVALKTLASGEFELVVSEVDLEPSDGFDLLRQVRAESWGRDVLWVFLTRKAGRADVQTGFQLGATDFVSKPAAAEVFVAKLKQLIERNATSQTAKGVSGSLSEMSLPDIVQILWHGRKTGALRIRCRAESGEIHFQDGNIVNAMLGKLRGEDAFFAMLKLQDGEFGLDPNFKPTSRVIDASPETLLLEGMRRLDEGVS